MAESRRRQGTHVLAATTSLGKEQTQDNWVSHFCSSRQVARPLLSHPDAQQPAEQKLALTVTKAQILMSVKSLFFRVCCRSSNFSRTSAQGSVFCSSGGLPAREGRTWGRTANSPIWSLPHDAGCAGVGGTQGWPLPH